MNVWNSWCGSIIVIPLGRPDVLRIAASSSRPRHQQQGSSSSPAMPYNCIWCCQVPVLERRTKEIGKREPQIVNFHGKLKFNIGNWISINQKCLHASFYGIAIVSFRALELPLGPHHIIEGRGCLGGVSDTAICGWRIVCTSTWREEEANTINVDNIQRIRGNIKRQFVSLTRLIRRRDKSSSALRNSSAPAAEKVRCHGEKVLLQITRSNDCHVWVEARPLCWHDKSAL